MLDVLDGNILPRVKRVQCTNFVATDPDVPDMSLNYIYCRSKMQAIPRDDDDTNPLERAAGELTKSFDMLVEKVLRASVLGLIESEYRGNIFSIDYGFDPPRQSDWVNTYRSYNTREADVRLTMATFRDRNRSNPTHAYCDHETLYQLTGVNRSEVAPPNVPNSEAYVVDAPLESIEFMDMVWTIVDTSGKGEIAFVNWATQPLHLIGPRRPYQSVL